MIASPLPSYRGLTVAVTGASGYLASALLAALRHTEARVIAISRHALRPEAAVETMVADIRLPAPWQALVNRADVVFHLAADTQVAAVDRGAGRLEPAAIQHLATAAQHVGRCPRVIFTSTATVYGFTDRLPVDEAAPASPQTAYDRQKLHGEQQLAIATTQRAVDGTSLRLSNVYGPSAAAASNASRGFLNQAAARALRGQSISLYGDGGCLRDFVYIDDVVLAMLLVGCRPGTAGMYNVASGAGTTMREAVRLVTERAQRITGRQVAVSSVAWPVDRDPIDRRSFTANVDLIARDYGWRPATLLADGLDQLMAAEGSAACAS